MLRLLSEARFHAIIAGTLKQIPLIKNLLPKKTGGSINARYCYSVWMRHLCYLSVYNGNKVPVRIAELGPGDSLGVGLAAVLSGSEKYFALDIIKYWQPERNVKMLNDLLILFNSKTNIPDNIEFPHISPVLDDYSFPSQILTDDKLKGSLAPERIERIKRELENLDDSSNSIIKFRMPWFDCTILKKNSIDFVLSQAVLQHVDNLEDTYKAMNYWLCDQGYISHVINFKSHGLTKSWNGHWTLSEIEWRIARGGRVYAINRQPISIHRKFLEENHFTILCENTSTTENHFKKTDLAKQFSNLTDEDLITSGFFYVAIKN